MRVYRMYQQSEHRLQHAGMQYHGTGMTDILDLYLLVNNGVGTSIVHPVQPLPGRTSPLPAVQPVIVPCLCWSCAPLALHLTQQTPQTVQTHHCIGCGRGGGGGFMTKLSKGCSRGRVCVCIDKLQCRISQAASLCGCLQNVDL
jgi:hypothetical protein